MQKARENVDVSSLKDSPHNPPNRITPANIRVLKDSIEEFGLLQPIIIGLDHTIIEGHRRVACARALGWEKIEANVIKDADNDAIYGSINTSSRKLSGSDALHVWLSNPRAVVRTQQLQFAAMVDVLGRTLSRKICDRGYSRRVFLTAVRIAKYCESNDNETVREIVEWLLEFPVIGQVMKALDAGESPKTIMKAVKTRKPIRMKLAIEA